jgi:hypothetical protein
MSASKPCKACGAVKCLDDFSRNPKMADGHLHTCKACEAINRRAYSLLPHVIERRKLRERRRLNDPVKRQRQIEHMKKWRSAPENRIKIAERRKRYYERHPEKRKAHKAVETALRRGLIKRQPCRICGSRAMAHHEDYSKPLAVIWLCPKHHRHLHAGLITSLAEAQAHLREIDGIQPRQ